MDGSEVTHLPSLGNITDIYESSYEFYDNVTTESVNNSLVGNDTLLPTKVYYSSLSWDDATWILTSSFIIFTMQSGFGLLEAGAVNAKNEVNIMVKNAVDVVFGGITYWAFGYGLSFGMDKGSNPFCGVGYWFVESHDPETMGAVYSTFIFQLSFATTATTIVSGAMAERTHLYAYIIFSLVNTIVYCIPAHWVWAENGFLYQLGVIDIAGSGAVHLLGAASAFVAAWMLGPRLGRYDNGRQSAPLGNGTNSMVGMFMLWWGWLAFNCGSTFGISNGKWILAARTATTTLNASMGGGMTGIAYSIITTKGKILVPDIVNAILGALVAITASCALVRPWEAVIIGAIGGVVSSAGAPLLDLIKVDDPVGAVAVHGFGGIWGMLAVGFFVDEDKIEGLGGNIRGLFHGGGFYSLGVQTLACVIIIVWSMLVTFGLLWSINKVVSLRMSEVEERLGSDFVEHDIGVMEQLIQRNLMLGYDGPIPKLLEQRKSVFGFKSPKLSVREIAKQEGLKEEHNGSFSLQDEKAKETQNQVRRRVYESDDTKLDSKKNGCIV